MADHGDQVNMNGAWLSENTYRVKEEQWQEDSFVEDKVYISETAITVDNAELQGPIAPHGKIKEYEEFAPLAEIKTELTLYQVTEIQNDNVKIEEGISADDMKIEFDDSLLYLAQCPSSQIHSDAKEYLEHHTSFCCERNDRKSTLPTPSAKQPTTALNGRKRCLRQIDKYEDCRYRMKHQADLKEHINNRHYEVKMYKCGICNRCFKAKESLSLHVQNAHAYVGGKGNQEDATTDYRNTKIIVEQSSTRGQRETFKCFLCVFRAKCKQSVTRHIKTKHLEKFNYKCGKCEFRTNGISDLEKHIKTKHLKKFDCICDKCEYRTNKKWSFQLHIKTKHLKQFDYNCDSCGFGANSKQHLEIHIKTKHLKLFDYKCHCCEYRTNFKQNLEEHIKTKHLKKFDFKCDSCEFETNRKCILKKHIKTKHLSDFDFKCDSCEYRTNHKNSLENHMKRKHL